MPTTVTVDGAATPTPQVAAHVELVAGDVTTVELVNEPSPPGPLPPVAVREVEVVVLAATEPVWFTVDGSQPAVRGPRSYVLPAGVSADTRVPTSHRPTRVRLLSAAAATVSVQVVR